MDPRIALIGYGKMGREIHQLATETGVSVTAIIDPRMEEYSYPMTVDMLRNTEVCIECTSPEAVMDNIRTLALLKKDLVIGTTGWLARLDEARAVAAQNDIGLLYASNFSIGMHMFLRIAAIAARLLSGLRTYDAAVHETHHMRKKDAPSGTALSLANAVMANWPEKTFLVTGNKEGAFERNELHVSSTRLGAVPGIHSVIFDGAADTIELTHTARNRRGLAEGALLAARWIHGKKGLFTMEDMLNDIESV
jgi:4-hydroxy-tetrahydrodipicolinate reductase